MSIRCEKIGRATLYCADFRDLPGIVTAEHACITDPPWPEARGIPGADDPCGLLADAAPEISRAARVVVIAGQTSTPAFVQPLCQHLEFITILNLKYALPRFRGRVLYDSDIAYCFGKPIPSSIGHRVIPTICLSTGRTREEQDFTRSGKKVADLPHPMARHLNHMRWLVKWWCDLEETVIDPFMGSGTTGVAAVEAGIRFVGIEIYPQFFDIACKRIDRAQDQMRMAL